MMEYCITELTIYPVKSLGGIAVPKVQLTQTGFEYDRRWMLVDAQNRFVSQREWPKLCLFQVSFLPTGFQIMYQSQSIIIPFFLQQGLPIQVRIWDDPVMAFLAAPAINEWFSYQLEMPVRLVYLPDTSQRNVVIKDQVYSSQVSFADAYPILGIGEEALNFLNQQLEHQIPMNRFRPNLVFSGGNPHDEDQWKELLINGVSVQAIKPCARCVVTTINQQTGVNAHEPLAKLATYRKKENKILFGQNMIAASTGYIEIGHTIEIISKT